MANHTDAELRPDLFLPLGTNVDIPWNARTPRTDLMIEFLEEFTLPNEVPAKIVMGQTAELGGVGES
uniref:Uncharacterized protein n=1 Tax=Oryza punctata TaxID=4537 RepID=A0A0E0LBJ0_ORYPU